MPLASASTAALNCAYVSETRWWQETIASASGKAAAGRSRLALTVSASSGVVLVPCAYDSIVPFLLRLVPVLMTCGTPVLIDVCAQPRADRIEHLPLLGFVEDLVVEPVVAPHGEIAGSDPLRDHHAAGRRAQPVLGAVHEQRRHR